MTERTGLALRISFTALVAFTALQIVLFLMAVFNLTVPEYFAEHVFVSRDEALDAAEMLLDGGVWLSSIERDDEEGLVRRRWFGLAETEIRVAHDDDEWVMVSFDEGTPLRYGRGAAAVGFAAALAWCGPPLIGRAALRLRKR